MKANYPGTYQVCQSSKNQPLAPDLISVWICKQRMTTMINVAKTWQVPLNAIGLLLILQHLSFSDSYIATWNKNKEGKCTRKIFLAVHKNGYSINCHEFSLHFFPLLISWDNGSSKSHSTKMHERQIKNTLRYIKWRQTDYLQWWKYGVELWRQKEDQHKSQQNKKKISV